MTAGRERDGQTVIAAIKARAQANIRCDVCRYLLATMCTCPGGPRGDAA